MELDAAESNKIELWERAIKAFKSYNEQLKNILQ